MGSTLPDTGFVRLPQIIGSAKARPPIPALIPVSRSTWWAGVKSGFIESELIGFVESDGNGINDKVGLG